MIGAFPDTLELQTVISQSQPVSAVTSSWLSPFVAPKVTTWISWELQGYAIKSWIGTWMGDLLGA